MPGVPDDAVAAAERLTRLARAASDPAEAAAYRERRDERLADHGYVARVREDDDVLVVHPDEWVDPDGTARPGRMEDLDRAVEVPLSGPGPADDWAAVAEHNDAVAAAVRTAHGDVHGDTARAFADFMSNHYARRVETATDDERREFREEYFPRNAWPSADQEAALSESLSLVFAVAEEVGEEAGARERAAGAHDEASGAPEASDAHDEPSVVRDEPSDVRDDSSDIRDDSSDVRDDSSDVRDEPSDARDE